MKTSVLFAVIVLSFVVGEKGTFKFLKGQFELSLGAGHAGRTDFNRSATIDTSNTRPPAAARFVLATLFIFEIAEAGSQSPADSLGNTQNLDQAYNETYNDRQLIELLSIWCHLDHEARTRLIDSAADLLNSMQCRADDNGFPNRE